MRLKLALLSAILVILQIVTNASAQWYAGFQYPGVYGLQASISTPEHPIPIFNNPPGMQSSINNWVSLSGPNWIQAGWDYEYESNNSLSGPNQFVETCIGGCNEAPGRYIMHFDPQSWNTTVLYTIDFYPGTPGNNVWCASINGNPVKCQAIITPPWSGQVMSEIQINSQNELNTSFNSVSYKGIDSAWHLFDQNESLSKYFPYDVQVFQPYNFRTYRSKVIFLPIMIK
jgi:hypothetical protein